MNIEHTLIRELKPYPNNARTHSTKQIRQIAKSIERFGFNNAVLVNEHKQIIAGHGRVEAAKLLGLHAVPTVQLSHLSDTEMKAYILADNKLAEKAGWDREVLSIELQGLLDHNFAMGCGEMTEGQFTGFLETNFRLLAVNSVSGSIHMICMDWRHMAEMLG